MSRRTDVWAEIDSRDEIVRAILSKAIIPDYENNLLALLALAAGIRIETLVAGGAGARESAAKWAETSYLVGLAVGSRLRVLS